MQKNDDHFSITFSDLLVIFRRSKTSILITTAILGLFFLLYTLTRPVEYEAESTFREKAKSAETSNTASLAMIIGLPELNENAAISLMKSRKLVERVIRKRDLQARILPAGFNFAIFHNIPKNLVAEYAYYTRAEKPLISDLNEPLLAKQVHYEGETPLKLLIRFVDEESYAVSQPNGPNLGLGVLGTTFIGPSFRFTLTQNDKNSLKNQKFVLLLKPAPMLADELIEKIFAQPDSTDKGLLNLSFLHKNRYEAHSFLNALMEMYQVYLKEEHQRITSDQVAYLYKRQEETREKLQQMMQEHAQALSENMATIEFLFHNQQSFSQKILMINFELKRLDKALAEGLTSYDKFGIETGDSAIINQILSEMRRHKQHVDTIDMALRTQDQNLSRRKVGFTEQGINLETASQLYISFSKSLNEIEADRLHHKFIIDQLQDPLFEPSSLSSALQDPVSREIINRAGAIGLELKNENNHTQRELDRLRLDLAQQKDFLKIHTEQTLQLLALRQKLFQEKLVTLQIATRDLLQQEIALLEKNLSDYLVNRMGNLKHEQSVIEQQQLALRETMQKMPAKWAAEKLIDQYLETNRKMMEEIAKMVETKNIALNLDLSQSAPVDHALAPLNPQSRKAVLFLLLGSILGTFLSMGFVLTKAVAEGMPATPDSLAHLGQYVAGYLAKSSSLENLETLRRAVSRINKKEPLLLLLNRGPNYSSLLAKMLSQAGKKVLILSLTPSQAEDSSSDEPDTLYPYLEGRSSTAKISKGESYDSLASGPVTPFATEILRLSKFQELLKELKQNYDSILIVSQAPLSTSTAEAHFNFFDQAIITLDYEKNNDLQSYLISKKLVSFIFINC